MSRRKNPHPQRAVNVKTVVVGDDDEEEEGVGEEPLVLCLQIPPDEDDDVFVVVDEKLYRTHRTRTVSRSCEYACGFPNYQID